MDQTDFGITNEPTFLTTFANEQSNDLIQQVLGGSHHVSVSAILTRLNPKLLLMEPIAGKCFMHWSYDCHSFAFNSTTRFPLIRLGCFTDTEQYLNLLALHAQSGKTAAMNATNETSLGNAETPDSGPDCRSAEPNHSTLGRRCM